MPKETVQSLLSTFIHDLNNSLTVLNLSLDDKDIESAFRETKSMEKGLKHISTLFYLEQNEFSLSDTNISQVVEKICKSYFDAKISFHIQNDIHTGLNSHILLEYILEELIDNAFQHQSKMVHVECYQDHDACFIKVQDDGVGIVQEECVHIFLPFYRTLVSRKSGLRGLGLGLFMVKKAMDYLGGDITVETVHGNTVFQLKFTAINSKSDV